MVQLNGFDAGKIPERQDFTAVPAGKYLVIMAKSEQKDAKKKPNKYLEVVFEIIDGPHKGRKLWVRLNIWHSSATAVEIALGELAEICKAVGIEKPGDTSELHNKPLIATVTIDKEEYNGQKQNKITKYEPNGKFSERVTEKPKQSAMENLPDFTGNVVAEAKTAPQSQPQETDNAKAPWEVQS